MTTETVRHTPVLVTEVLEIFSPQPGNCLLDATLGHGGHTQAYLEATNPNGTVIGFDADPEALAVARETLKKYGGRVKFVNQNFSHLNDAVKWGGMVAEGSSFTHAPPNHILFDLGLGSHQLADQERGFSFTSTGPLTMAYGNLEGLPDSHLDSVNALQKHLGLFPDAEDLLAGLSAADLAELIRQFGEERYAERVAGAIKRHLPLMSAKDVAEVIAEALPGNYEHGRIHPATRTLQALRLAVNRELETLEAALPQAVGLLAAGGVVAVISFHSLEDRIVKNFFRSRKGELEILAKKPMRASQAEIRGNPRARSAKLRAAKKIVSSE